MISSTCFTVVVLTVTWSRAAGLPFSGVYVQSGPDVLPVEYLRYGPPNLPVGAPVLGQLTAPFGNLVPCVPGPCVPNQGVISAGPSSAKLVTYKAPVPSVPVVVTPTKEDLSYQYSYVVYDENTGDQKAQAELSNNGVVQGQYSLIQPDGYVREVSYSADDLKGFNAVVKNFLPNTQNNDATKPDESQAVPCNDGKSAALVELTSEPVITDAPALGTVPTEETTTTIYQPSPTEGQTQIIPNGLLSYNDIIKCLQAALKGTDSIPKQAASPLTYVILNKPC